jgi:hypothetical protein
MKHVQSGKLGGSESALRQRAADWNDYPSLESLTEAALRHISRVEGIDFATAVLFDRFQKCPRHTQFIRRIDTLLEPQQNGRTKIDAKIIIVPGALYVERPELGGDGKIVRQVAESFGYETDLIPISSCGSIRKNASLIRDWFIKRREERMIIVSLSKGSADLKFALAAPDAEQLFTNVVAWVNVCGPLNGSRIADWVLSNPLRSLFCRTQFLLQRRDFQFLTELRHDNGTLLNCSLRLPPSLKILNLIGFPLRQQITTRFSRFCHRTLAAWGPNDGTTSLSDIAHWPGDIYPVWGADHYFKPEALAKRLIIATLRYVGEEVQRHGFAQALTQNILLDEISEGSQIPACGRSGEC